MLPLLSSHLVHKPRDLRSFAYNKDFPVAHLVILWLL